MQYINIFDITGFTMNIGFTLLIRVQGTVITQPIITDGQKPLLAKSVCKKTGSLLPDKRGIHAVQV